MSLLIVIAVSILAAALGVLGLAAPNRLGSFVSLWQSKTGLWTASIMRLVFGVAIWLVAPVSRTPLLFQILAVASVAAGFALPFLGLARFAALLAWWLRHLPGFVRVWSAAALLLGGVILWSVAG